MPKDKSVAFNPGAKGAPYQHLSVENGRDYGAQRFIEEASNPRSGHEEANAKGMSVADIIEDLNALSMSKMKKKKKCRNRVIASEHKARRARFPHSTAASAIIMEDLGSFADNFGFPPFRDVGPDDTCQPPIANLFPSHCTCDTASRFLNNGLLSGSATGENELLSTRIRRLSTGSVATSSPKSSSTSSSKCGHCFLPLYHDSDAADPDDAVENIYQDIQHLLTFGGCTLPF